MQGKRNDGRTRQNNREVVAAYEAKRQATTDNTDVAHNDKDDAKIAMRQEKRNERIAERNTRSAVASTAGQATYDDVGHDGDHPNTINKRQEKRRDRIFNRDNDSTSSVDRVTVVSRNSFDVVDDEDFDDDDSEDRPGAIHVQGPGSFDNTRSVSIQPPRADADLFVVAETVDLDAERAAWEAERDALKAELEALKADREVETTDREDMNDVDVNAASPEVIMEAKEATSINMLNGLFLSMFRFIKKKCWLNKIIFRCTVIIILLGIIIPVTIFLIRRPKKFQKWLVRQDTNITSIDTWTTGKINIYYALIDCTS